MPDNLICVYCGRREYADILPACRCPKPYYHFTSLEQYLAFSKQRGAGYLPAAQNMSEPFTLVRRSEAKAPKALITNADNLFEDWNDRRLRAQAAYERNQLKLLELGHFQEPGSSEVDKSKLADFKMCVEEMFLKYLAPIFHKRGDKRGSD